MRTFIQRHSVVTYFLLAFVISWGGVLALVAPAGIPAPAAQVGALFPRAYVAMLFGPTVAGLLMVALVDGGAGLRALGARLLRWRVGAQWYAAALLLAPVVTVTVLLALSLTAREYLPGMFGPGDTLPGPFGPGTRGSILAFGLGVGLGAGLFEELGWTGFAIPALRQRWSVLATGLLLGVLWGGWHFLVSFWGSGTAEGTFSAALFVPALISALGVLPAFRVLMVWVYDRTQSLLVAMLMHASLTATTLTLTPGGTTGDVTARGNTYGLALTVALWIVVAAIGLVRHGQLGQRPLHGRLA